MPSPTLIELFRYPVKSMMGESLTAAEATEAGVHGDRAWAASIPRTALGGRDPLGRQRHTEN